MTFKRKSWKQKRTILWAPYPTFAVLLFVLVAVGCSVPHPQISQYSPPVVINLEQMVVTNEYCLASFELKNITDQRLWFHGFEQQEKTGYPLYVLQYKRLTGGWEEIDNGWFSGTGIGSCKLLPGSSTHFALRTRAGIPFRVGVRVLFSSRKNPALPEIVYWSDTVTSEPLTPSTAGASKSIVPDDAATSGREHR